MASSTVMTGLDPIATSGLRYKNVEGLNSVGMDMIKYTDILIKYTGQYTVDVYLHFFVTQNQHYHFHVF